MGKYKGVKCPVCGEYRYQICGNCGWEHSDYQEENPDEGGFENLFSLNESRKIWEKEHRNLNEVAAERIKAAREKMVDK